MCVVLDIWLEVMGSQQFVCNEEPISMTVVGNYDDFLVILSTHARAQNVPSMWENDTYSDIQCNPSNPDTNGSEESDPCSEVSS